MSTPSGKKRPRPPSASPSSKSADTNGAGFVAPGDLRELVDTFDSEGYAAMSLDSVRNAAFAKAIHYCVKVGEQRTWLEVGAGADALLTRFVLRSGTVGVGRLASISTSAAAESSKLVLTQTRVCAVEGGAPAAASARRHLAPFRAERVARQRKLKVEGGPGGVAPVALESAWALVQGVSSEPSAARSVAAVAAAWRLPTGRFPAILHELLGFFASSEWAVQSDNPVWRVCDHSPTAFNFYSGPNGAQVQMRRVPFEEIAALREPRVVRRSELFGGGSSEPVASVGAGCLELLRFGDPAVLARETRHRVWLNPPDAPPARCNALAFWLWIQAGPVPQQSNRCFTSAGTTLFPYGCADDDVRACRPLNAPALSSCMLDFGGHAFSHGWRNFVLFFAGPPAAVAEMAAECAAETGTGTVSEKVAASVAGADVVPDCAADTPVTGASLIPVQRAEQEEAVATTAGGESASSPSLASPVTRPAAVSAAAPATGGEEEEEESGIVVPSGGSLRVDTRVHVAPGRAPWYHVIVRVLPPPPAESAAPGSAADASGAASSVDAPLQSTSTGSPGAADKPPEGSDAAATVERPSAAEEVPRAVASAPTPQPPLHVFSCIIDTSGRGGEDALVQAFCAEVLGEN